MLWESVTISLLGLVIFGLVSGAKGKTGMCLRMGVGVVITLSALNASLEFFGHPGWEGALEGQKINGRGAAVFMLAYLAGPTVLGVIFLGAALFAASGVRSEWLDVTGSRPGPWEGKLYSALSLVFHPVELMKQIASKGRELLSVPGLAVILASLIVSAALFRVADKL